MVQSPTYAHVEIHIHKPEDTGYPIQVTRPDGLTSFAGHLPPDIGPSLYGKSPPEASQSLSEVVLANPQIKPLWAGLFGQGQPLRIRLRLDPDAPELHDLPWELLTDLTGQPLATNPATPFARYLALEGQAARLAAELPFKLLAVVAAPDNLARYNLAPLNIEAEQAFIHEALADRIGPTLQVDFLDQPVTLARLDGALQQGYHALHLISHTGTGQQGTALFLADDQNQVRPVADQACISLFTRQRQWLKFVFLAGGKTSALALSAVAAGIPAAIGLADFVPISSLQSFTQTFYRQLLSVGQVDLAGNEGRARLLLDGTAGWHHFILHSRLPDGQLLAPSLVGGTAGPTPKISPTSPPPLTPAPKAQPPEPAESVAPDSSTTLAESVPPPAPTEPTSAEPPPTGPLIGNLGGASNDEVAQEDYLGFNQYVEAFARLITAKETTPPLTIGIYGSWGMGKSFLLEHLKRRLQQTPAAEAEAGQPKVHVIEFNAWEYSANEVIWPGLVRTLMQTLEKEVKWGFFDQRVRRRLWRNFKSQFSQQRPQLIIGAAAIVAILTLAIWQLRNDLTLFASFLAALGIGGFVSLIKLINDAIAEPFSQWITALFQQEDPYGKPIDYMTRIRADLDLLEKKLGQDERVLVLIDDLDRCEPNKAVEVLQAIKLLLNFNKYIICLGIDARVITRAIEKYYEDLLGPAGASGYEYLDKIIQIPFRIPTPNPDEIREFINKQMGEPLPPLLDQSLKPAEISDFISTPAERKVAVVDKVRVGEEVKVSLAPAGPPDQETPPSHVESLAFTHFELEAFQNLARFLRPNPRHIKRLLNIYRLVRTLAQLKGQKFILDYPATTICWLVICGQWPYTTYQMLQHYNEMLEDEAEGQLKVWPTGDPLTYLLEQVQDKLLPEKQQKLDHDPDLLRQLLATTERNLGWAELRLIRPYTINFNPAVEAELHFESPEVTPTQTQADHPPEPADNQS